MSGKGEERWGEGGQGREDKEEEGSGGKWEYGGEVEEEVNGLVEDGGDGGGKM